VTEAVPLDKSAASIRGMFAGVAPRYDLLNHLLSGSLDALWRRRTTREAARVADGPILDLCAGTGDQAVALGRLGRPVVAADFCLPMIARAPAKFRRLRTPVPAPLAADALQLPFKDGHFALVTVSFGVRNLADLDRGLRQMLSVLRPGGRLVVLEFALPRLPVLRPLYLFYLRHVLPLLGRLLSPRGSAYGYLRDSVLVFPQRDEFVAHLHRSGFEDARWTDLSAGTVCLYTARRPEAPI